MHVVGTELVPESAMSLGAWQRQVVQLQFVALVPAKHTVTSGKQSASLPAPVA